MNVMGVALHTTNKAYADNRGMFRELETGVENAASITLHRHTLRGLHGDPRMGKHVTCLSGVVYDVVADVRRDSPTYGKWDRFILDGTKPEILIVPPGCAHGFLTLTTNVVFYYAKTNNYDPAREFTVNYADPTLNIEWPCEPWVISKKDSEAPFL